MTIIGSIGGRGKIRHNLEKKREGMNPLWSLPSHGSYSIHEVKGFVNPSLGVCATTIAERSVSFLTRLLALILNTTICSVKNLCIVKGRCLLNLALDDSKRIHCVTPKVIEGF